MLIMETIAKIRHAFAGGQSKRQIAIAFHMSRNTVRKVLREGYLETVYKKRKKGASIIDDYRHLLNERLEFDNTLRPRERRKSIILFEELQRDGYTGSYDTVRRYVKDWKADTSSYTKAFVPLTFRKGEAFQFDWSEEHVEIDGICVKVQVAQMRLCYSRMPFVMAFLYQRTEMVLEAHCKGHDFFGGLCERGIYDNPKTIIIRAGKEHILNRRFLAMSSHYLFSPELCNPVSPWEKGQVENQVNVTRNRFFTPRLRFTSLDELNAHLAEQCRVRAKTAKHPEFTDKTIFEVFQEEQAFLRTQTQHFDSYTATQTRVSMQCLVHFDRNKYSAPCEYVGKAVEVRAYAGKIVIAHDGNTIAEHVRDFHRDKFICNPLHYLPILIRKPGALRNGRPFVEWDLPVPLANVRQSLKHFPDGDRQFSQILIAIIQNGIEAVSVACEMALDDKIINATTVLNYVSRLTEERPPAALQTSDRLSLSEPPVANCARYDQLREASHAA